MNSDRLALVVVSMVVLAVLGRDFVQQAQGAAAPPPVRFQGVAPVPTSANAPSLLWLIGDDGKVRLCRGYAKLNVPPPVPDWDVACSPAISPP